MDETFADFAKDPISREVAVFEDHFGGFTGAHAQFTFFFTTAETFVGSLNNEGGHAVAVK